MYGTQLDDGYRLARRRPRAHLALLALLLLIGMAQLLLSPGLSVALLLGLLRTLLFCLAAVLARQSLEPKSSGAGGAGEAARRTRALFLKVLFFFLAIGLLLGALRLLFSLFGPAGLPLSILLTELQTLFLLYYIAAALDADLTQAALDACSAMRNGGRFFLLSLLLLTLPTALNIVVTLILARPDLLALLAASLLETTIQFVLLFALIARRFVPDQGATSDADGETKDVPPESMAPAEPTAPTEDGTTRADASGPDAERNGER